MTHGVRAKDDNMSSDHSVPHSPTRSLRRSSVGNTGTGYVKLREKECANVFCFLTYFWNHNLTD
eukprot:5277050-Amphidinium_carterae.1